MSITPDPPNQTAGRRELADPPVMSGRPARVRLRRSRGWRKPPGVVVVARPTRWGNPFVVGRLVDHDGQTVWVRDRAHAVRLYQRLVAGWEDDQRTQVRRHLGGRDLACWCPTDQPCHADVLLTLANS